MADNPTKNHPAVHYIGPPEVDPCMSWKIALDAESQNSARLANELNAAEKVADAALAYLNATERARVVIYPEVRELREALANLAAVKKAGSRD